MSAAARLAAVTSDLHAGRDADRAVSATGSTDAIRIVLRGVHVHARVGWGAEERRTPQLLLVDLDLDLSAEDLSAGDVTAGDLTAGDLVFPGAEAGRSPVGSPGDDAERDDLADTVDYAELAGRVAATVSASGRRLLETVASDVLTEVLRDRRVDAATVTVHKPRAPLPVAVDDVAVVRTRRRTLV